uniref:Uncharacterized protein n=1 Tax=Talaromyces marneffei PM1 TaxID=1077442 RepID=A0A093VN82_TALMA
MSASTVLSQLSVLQGHMESLAPKLISNIRPNRDQLNDFKTLSVQIKAASANIETNLQLLLRKGLPTKKDMELAAKLRSPEDISESASVNILRRNLITIFQGPDESTLDSNQAPHAILMWAMAFQPSAWNSTGAMTDNTFDYLIEELKTANKSRIAPQTLKTLNSMKVEAPLRECETFQKFVQNMSGLEIEHQVQAAETPSKRQRIEEVVTFSKESERNNADEDSRQQMELIKRSKEIDYKGSSLPPSRLPHFIRGLPAAIERSGQWRWERKLFAEKFGHLMDSDSDKTDCVNIFVPKDPNRDISIVLLVGYDEGLQLIYGTGVELIRG